MGGEHQMTNSDQAERIATAQALMVEITCRLEDLVELAVNEQLATSPNIALVDGVATVATFLETHRLLLLPGSKPKRKRR